MSDDKRILLRDATEDESPILLRRDVGDATKDDSRYQIRGEITRGGIGIVYKGFSVGTTLASGAHDWWRATIVSP